MNFELKQIALTSLHQQKTDTLLILVDDTFHATPEGEHVSHSAIEKTISHALKKAQLEPKAGKLLTLWNVPGVKANPVILAHCGVGTAKLVRQAVTLAAKEAKSVTPECKHLSLYLPSLGQERVQTAMQALSDSFYIYTSTKPSAKPAALSTAVICVEPLFKGSLDQTALQEAFEEGRARVAGMNFTKEWGNRPSNHATPTHLGQAAKTLASYKKIDVQVLGPKEVAKLGMGSFMSVAQGSNEPLRFIVMHYKGANDKSPPVVLIGKGITFDTGGISLKPGAGMDEMKFDMCGAATVLGVFKSLGELSPKINVVGLIPACENMPDGKSIKPGDVVTSMSGQTIEILNTDAEGRLILCDALTYAKRFKPSVVLDMATLTGACIIALGHLRSGLFTPHDDLAQALMAAGERTLDPCWRLPLDDEYAEGLKSNFADTANIGDRSAGSITAAKFLERFTQGLHWAHLDIAGSAWKSSGPAKGATARPLPMVLSYLIDQAKQAKSPLKTKPMTASAPANAKGRKATQTSGVKKSAKTAPKR